MAKQGAKTATPRLRFPEFRVADGWATKRMDSLYFFGRNNILSRDKLNYVDGTAKNIHYGDIHTKFAASFDVSREQVPFVNQSEALPDLGSGDYCVEGDLVFADASEDMNDVGKTMEIVRLRGEQVLARQHTILARQIGGALTTGFGVYLFGSGLMRARIKKEAQGTKVYQISAVRLGGIDVTYPSDKAEQQKIADCLTSLDEVIAAQGRKVEALKTHKRSLMQQLFPREGETCPHLRFPEFRNAPEWVVKKLSALIGLVSGMHLSPDQYSSSGDVPYFTGPSDFTNTVKCVTKWTTSSSSLAAQHDTLITVKGSGVGECWYLELPTVAMGRQLMALRSKASSSQFIHQFLLTKRTRFEDLASGNLIPGLSRGDILDMVAPFPKKEEQQRIADCLSSLDTQITAESNQLAAFKTHKQGLMQQLFPAPEGLGV